MISKNRLQELFVKLSFALMSAHTSDSRLPDVMGIVARAQSSPAAAAAQKEVAQIGEYVCDSSTAQASERGIIQYAQAVTELDVRFLEQIREEICTGMDGFDLVMSMKSTSGTTMGKQRLFKLAAFLVSLLERIAERLDTFYVELSAQSLYHPRIESNPARARWHLVRRRIYDGSFFIYTQDLNFDSISSFEFPVASKRISVSFDRVISQANEMVAASLHRQQASEDHDNLSTLIQRPPRRLADVHSRRAEDTGRDLSSFERHIDRKAANRISTFLTGNMKAVRRLSRAVDVGALEHALRTQSPLREPSPLRRQGSGLLSTRVHERSGSVSSSSSGSSRGSSKGSSRGERKSFLPGGPRDSLRLPMRGGRHTTRMSTATSVSGRSDGAALERALEGLRVRI
jgi:hypothetical protein